ncbi:unnamed protein product [Rhizophagus irregularis]|nr:unnamed protein product [Rhizophagus irregularis]
MAVFRYQKSKSSDWDDEGEVVLGSRGAGINGDPFKIQPSFYTIEQNIAYSLIILSAYPGGKCSLCIIVFH